MRLRMVAVAAAALIAAGLAPAVLDGRGAERAARPALPREPVPSGWVVRPATPVRPSPRPAEMARRTSGGTASYLTMYCFGHYARYRDRDVWVYGEVIDGASGWRREGWLWSGDVLDLGAYRLPYC